MFDKERKGLTEFPEMKTMVKTDTSKIHNDYEQPNTKGNLQANISQKEQMMNGNLVLSVHGDTRIHVGELINFELPYQVPVQGNDKQELNPYWAGRYLIMNLKHTIDMDTQKHSMTIKCAKDSTRISIPTETEEMVVKLKEKNSNSIVNIYEADGNIRVTDNNAFIRGA